MTVHVGELNGRRPAGWVRFVETSTRQSVEIRATVDAVAGRVGRITSCVFRKRGLERNGQDEASYLSDAGANGVLAPFT